MLRRCKTIFLAIASVLLLTSGNPYPTTLKDVAMNFATLFFAGDEQCTQYVKFDGLYLLEMGTTEDEFREKIFPTELEKNRANPQKVSYICGRDGEFEGYYYIVCKAGKNIHNIFLTKVEGQWKVDISDWFNENYNN